MKKAPKKVRVTPISARSNIPPITPNRRFLTRDELSRSTKNLSELSPLQIFQKEFVVFENKMMCLHQTHAPYGIEKIFDTFNSLKKRYPSFISACNSVYKKIQLMNGPVDISNEYKEVCNQFSLDFGDLLATLAEINSSIPDFYRSTLTGIFRSMRDNISKYGVQCLVDHRTRSVFNKQESFLKQNMEKCRIDIDALISDHNFRNITVDRTTHIVERLKQVSRKIEIEIPHTMSHQRITVPKGDSLIRSFHSDFVVIVPLLTGIPAFIEEMKSIYEKIPVFGQSLEDLMKSINIMPRSSTASELQVSRDIDDVTALSGNFPPHDEEPFDVFMPTILEMLDIEGGDSQEETFRIVIDTLQNIFDEHATLVHQLETRLSALKEINGNSSLAERCVENREYKEGLEKKYEAYKDEVYRNVLDQIESLMPTPFTSRSTSMKRQIDCVVNCVHEEFENNQKIIKAYEEEIIESKETLRVLRDKFIGAETNNAEYLPDIIDDTVQALENARRTLDQQLKDVNPSNNTLEEFLNDTLTRLCKKKESELKNLTIDRMSEMVGRHILDQDDEIKRLKANIKVAREDMKKSDNRGLSCISQIRYKLEEQLDSEKDVEPTFEDISERISELLKLHDNNNRDRFAFRQFLTSFLSQLLLAFQIPQIRFKDATYQQLKDVMTSILDTPYIQKALYGVDGALNSTPRGNNTSKTFSRRLTSAPQSPSTRQSRRTSVVLSSKKANTSRKGFDEADDKVLVDIKTKLAESCAIMENRVPASYMYIPLDALAKQVKDLSSALVKESNTTKGLICDIIVEMNEKKKIPKNDLLTKNNEELFEFIFKGMHLIKSEKTNMTTKTMRNICKNVGTEDVDFMDIDELVAFASSQMSFIRNTNNAMSSLTTIVKDINNQINANKSFNPLSDYFKRYVEKEENLSSFYLSLTSEKILPSVMPYISQTVSLIDHITKTLSSVTFAQEYNDNKFALEQLMTEHQKFKEDNEKLAEELRQAKDAEETIRNRLFDLIKSVKAVYSARVAAIKKVNADDLEQLMEYFKNYNPDDNDNADMEF